MGTSTSSWSWIILFLSVLLIFGAVYGGDVNVVPMESLRAASTCSPSSEGLPVMHRHGPCSPLAHFSPPPNSHQLFLKDQARVDFIQNLNSMNDDAPTSPVDTGDYVVTVGIGTPRRNYTLMLDTGSELTWIQSTPCPEACYPQAEPMYDPHASKTHIAHCQSGHHCRYNVTYADRSYSRGDYAVDTLTLDGSRTAPTFIFGCGHHNSQDFGGAAGLLGLSRGELSIVSQTTFGHVFCYCLPARGGFAGYLHFGQDALSKCRTPTSTPLLSRHGPYYSQFYFVDLVGITIGNKRLAVSYNSSYPNTLIDSGTPITRLPPSVYPLLRDEFRRLMSKYPLVHRLSLMDTCYDLTGFERVTIPKMAMHFKGADVDLDPSGVMWRENDTQVCLGFARNKHVADLNIIGNVQQRTLGILYNVPGKKVEFKTNAC